MKKVKAFATAPIPMKTVVIVCRVALAFDSLLIVDVHIDVA